MKYDDIINLPYKKSNKHPQMERIDRAQQFAPFAALVGYSDEITEAKRLTDKKIELSDEEKKIINDKLSIINSFILESPIVCIEFFVKDKLKDGGAYYKVIGSVKRIDLVLGEIILTDKTHILINDILNITGELFKEYDDINYI
ncbi:MAG: hypothetical protein J6R47_02225 [Acholeplasmatales bacterium]|nr:hypothetical protein [Acholeplasmatales bacterium]